MKIRLTMLQGGAKERRLKIAADRTIIGRSSDCDIRLDSRTVSRQHCELVQQGGKLILRDLGSRNHTQVGERTLHAQETCVLSHRDVLRIGKFRLRLSLRDEATNQPIVTQRTQDFRSDQPNPPEAPSSTDDLFSDLTQLVDRNQLQRVLEHQANADELTVEDDLKNKETPPREVEPATAVTATQPTDSSNETTTEMPPSQPQRIPKHLRPQRPTDSVDAAAEALRRMFSR